MAKKRQRMIRLSATAPEADVRALEALAEDNRSSIATEIRAAVVAHLKKNGRRI